MTMPTGSTAYSWIEIQLGSQWSSEICLPASSGLSLIPQQVLQSFPYSQNQVHAPSQSLLASLSIPLRIMSHQLRTRSASCLYRSKCLCIHTDLFIFCPVSKKYTSFLLRLPLYLNVTLLATFCRLNQPLPLTSILSPPLISGSFSSAHKHSPTPRKKAFPSVLLHLGITNLATQIT